MTRGWRARLCPRCPIMEEAEWSYWRTPTCRDKSTDFAPSCNVRSLPFTRASPLRTRSSRASSRRCTRVGVPRIIHVRAATEFVEHAVDRGESRTRELNVIGRWLQTTLLERCSARARLIPRVAKSRVPTCIYVLCRYDYLDCAAISLHLYRDTLNLVGKFSFVARSFFRRFELKVSWVTISKCVIGSTWFFFFNGRNEKNS